MSSKETGDAWLLLGTARFSQAGPGDRALRARAREAFVNARRYDTSRRQAADWIQYIDAINSTEEAQDRLERQQNIEAAQDDISRTKTQIQVCRLQGCSEAEVDRLEAQLTTLEERLATLQRSAPATAETENTDAEASDAETTTDGDATGGENASDEESADDADAPVTATDDAE